MVISSFDGVLRQPRTQHTLPFWPGGPRMPLPRPTPMIAFVYIAVLEFFLALINKALGLTTLLGDTLSFFAGGRADIAATVIVYSIPFIVVWTVLNAGIDGRAPYRWFYSAVTFALRGKRTLCGKRVRAPGKKVSCGGRTKILWDEDAPRLQHGWVRGGRVSTAKLVRFTHGLVHTKPAIKPDDRGTLIVDYEVAESLEVRR